MFKVTVEIDVNNAMELVKKNKGPLVAMFASQMNDQQIKAQVEEEVKKQVMLGLNKSLSNELKNQGVEATLKVY